MWWMQHVQLWHVVDVVVVNASVIDTARACNRANVLAYQGFLKVKKLFTSWQLPIIKQTHSLHGCLSVIQNTAVLNH